MKHSYSYRLFVGMWMCFFYILSATAVPTTQIDRLYTPDMIAWRGVTANLPVCMDNPHDVTAVQFNIGIPKEMKIDRDAFQLTNRSVDHEIITRLIKTDETKNWYQVMVFSPSNSLFAGRSGSIIEIKFTMGDEAVDGTQLTPAITDGVMSTVDRVNVLREVATGNISIVFGPDLVIPSINVTETNVSPGGELNLSWTVNNMGDEPCQAGWKEEISIIDGNASSDNYSNFSACYLGFAKYEDVLDGRSSVSRNVTIALPKLVGLGGTCRVMIRIVPFPESNERPESRINNTTVSQQVIEVEKHLTIQLNTDSVEEGRTHTVYATLSRSGSWDDEETFTVRSYGDDRVIVPSSVTIPKGQSAVRFDITITDNDDLDAIDAVATIEVADASNVNPYSAVSAKLLVEDDEFPDLSVNASKSVVNEGESFQLTITTSRASAQPIVVSLMSENSKRFSFPSQVTIPAGETSMTVSVETIDDEVPSLDLSNAFTVSAPKHNKAEVIVLLKDNDLPALELTLTPTTVSESVGVVAVIGTLHRTTNIDSKITVKLTDDADGGLYFGNRTLELAKGKEEVSFNFGPVDNANVDGDRTYNITAAVWLSSCNCGASGESAGYTTAQLQVLDNDGASLGLSSSVSTLKEGGTTPLTISRNTATSSPLTVTLSSDYSEGLTYPHSVTIPAGQKSTTVEVTSAVNDVEGDSHNVIFTIQADGYATGTCYITVTDQTKPDAVVSAIRTDRYEMEVGETVGLSVVVANKGIAVLPAHTAVRIDCSGGSGSKTLYIPSDLAAGDSVELVSDYQLPVTNTGTYTLTATVNPERNVSELNYNNNSLSSASITVKPNFSATVTVDKQVYRQGETVIISGQTSAGGRNADVEVYLVNNGTRQSITVKADGEGHFQTTYQPYNRQSGHFVVGACYPRTGETSGSAEFDVYGLLLSAVYATHDISLGDEAKGSFVIKNPGLLPQTGLQIERLNEPNGCELTIGEVSSIKANGQVEVAYSLKANEVSPGNDWLQVPLRITSSEGSTSTFTVYYYVRPLKGQLKASETRIETTMTKGVPREYQLQVTNVGRGETGYISLSLPSWIESLSASKIPSLNQGDTVTIALRMMPTDNMQLNVPITGQIGVNCEKGDGVAVGLHVTPVSEETGNLVIDVVDEYTYYAEGSPHVKDARVLVKHPTTGQVIAQGLTATDGHYSVELPEGWYTVSINADKHQSYQTTLEVAPGKTTGKEIFLTYEAITYSWEVEETEVEDEYEIETVVKYETNVPKPVIVVSLPEDMPEVGSIVPVVITNKGLISANNIDLTLSISEGLELEWLSNPSFAVLAPQQTVTFYACIRDAEEAGAKGVQRKSIVKTLKCLSLIARAIGHYICGEYEETIEMVSSRHWGECMDVINGGGTSSGNGGGGGWNGGGSDTTGSHPGYSPGGGGNNTYAGSSSSGTPPLIAKMCHERDIEEELTLPPFYKDDDWTFSKDCEVVITGHHLVSAVDGREVNGVAADGTATVFIRLAGIIPFTAQDYIRSCQDDEEALALAYSMTFCNNIPNWSIEEKIGKLDHTDGWQTVSYTAPEDFPGDPNESVDSVHVLLEYNGKIIYRIPIAITRVPLVLLHGYIGDYLAWDNFRDNVIKSGMYSEYQVPNKDYKEKNKDHFRENVPVAGERINDVINKYLAHGIVAKKADLVGHSMGGIIARLHVQYAEDGDKTVHKVITVNTPHSGSRLGAVADFFTYFQEQVNSTWPDLINSIFGTDIGFDFTILHAGRDLWNQSPETYNYLNDKEALKKMENIPVHAIVTYGMNYMPDDDVLDEIKEEGTIAEWLWLMFKTGCFTIIDTAVDGRNDVVVSVESQKGGLEEPFISVVPYQWHMGSPRNPKVQEYLIELLNAPVNSTRFCKTGFNPTRIYKSKEKNMMSGTMNSPASRNSSSENLVVTANVSDNTLKATMTGSEGYDYKMLLVQFGKHSYLMSNNTQVECEVPASFSGEARVYGIVRMEGEDVVWDVVAVNIDKLRTTIERISISDLSMEVGESNAVTLTCSWADGAKTLVKPDDVMFTDHLAYYEDGYITGLHSGSGTATFTYQGLNCEAPFTVYNFGKSDDGEGSESVCSTITLKLSQTMTMTRQAFRGTLTMFNGNEHASMRDVKLTLQVTNKETGEVATSHEFQINPESIDGFTGEVDLSSGWTLAGNATGKATVLFIPTKYAAPTEPVEWSFGGTLSYLDPFTGLEVTRDLYPVTLTVKPSPELDLDYFLQRDVYGDDPLTEEVEPMQPAEFALLINNKGYGDATNVRMVTQQPQIIDNEKGLLIDFELLSSQVNGSDKTLAFGQSVANDFGTIAAQSQAYAQWWLQSSLLGHFTEYSVKANHVTSYGNEDLSLLDQVNIHELIHGFTPTTGGRGFLVNDIVDAADMPDRVYFTDATQEDVSIATNATITKQGDDYVLTVLPAQTGWNYGSLIDPTDGKQQIMSITRMSDGKEIPLDNVWRTDRTLRDGKDPIAENRLHFVGNILSDSESYLLSFTPREEVSNVVTGHVAAQTENGQPVVGATVTLCSGDVVYTTTTDGAGYFTLKVDETSLDYVMTCTAEGFIDGAEKEVRFLGDAVKCNYTLMPGATIKIPASGICTYSSVVGLDFSQATLPVKAYYGKRYDTERVIIDELTTAAANEGLVLMGQPNSRVDVPEAVNVAPLAENVLYGTAFAPYTVTSDDVYVLANKTGKPKFHQAAQGLVIPKNKAYLLLFIGESGSKGIDVIFDEATLIDMIRSAENRENHYGIDGIRIGETVKGIHVVKGKKLIVK